MKKSIIPFIGLFLSFFAFTSCEYDGIDPITAVDAGQDAGSPVITILYPSDGTAIQVPEAVASINIRFEVVDDIEVEKVEVLVNGNQIAMLDEFLDYRVVKATVPFDNVTNGEHTLTIIATDISGNVTTQEVTFSKEPPYSPKYAGEFFYMPFNGDFMELVNIYTAEEVGSPAISGDAFLGTGAYRGVADSYITVPLNEEDLGAEFSAAFWYKMDTTVDRAGILTATDNNEDRHQGFRLFREGSATSQTIKLNIGTGPGTESWNDGTSIEVTGEWVHIAFSISASETVFYVNGINVRTAGMSTTIDWTGVDELIIGSGLNFTDWGHRSEVNSLIDELRLFNTAITQNEIQGLINASAETLYMPFDGQYRDMVSNREVTVVGSPGLAGESVEGSDAYAGAADAYLTLPSAGLLSEEFSTTFWYKVNASPDRAGIIVISAMNAENPALNYLNSGFHLFREGSATEQRIKASIGTGNGQVWNDGGVIDVAAGEWVHVAFTISNSESKIYLDGVLTNTAAVPGGVHWSASDVDWSGTDLVSIMSGAPRFTEWNHLSDRSYMDELRFYNKALTQEEIQAAMAQ